ncbi:hypothetical protein C6P46_005648, partial [Rhodotorula mucilaginosa]
MGASGSARVWLLSFVSPSPSRFVTRRQGTRRGSQCTLKAQGMGSYRLVEMARNNTERKTRSALTDVVAREYTIRLHTAVHGKGFKH